MTAAQPYLVVSASGDLGEEDTAPYKAFLDWIRSEGIDPNLGNRCEVYEGDGAPYAVLTMFTLDDKGHRIIDEERMESVTHTETVTLSSLPPTREM